MANDLLVRILGDTKGLERSLARANTATATFGRNVEGTGAKLDKTTRSLKGFATGAAAGFGGAVVFNELSQQITAAISVASNLQEQMAKTGVVFGQAADEVEAWSKTTAEGIGLAQDQALAAASTFGAMFDQAGRSASDAAGLSKAVVQLAADLASFNNTNVDESLAALRSGLSGEIEPLRRFQVFLTEAAVAQQAMADTGKTNAAQLTQGEKIMARWALILQQTSKQQGDFARTSGGLANQQRILTAQVRDLQASLGGLLLPAMTRLVDNMNSATQIALELGDALAAIGRVKIPVIEIPLRVVFDKGLGNLPTDFAKNLLPSQVKTALPFVDIIRDLLKPDTKPDVNAAADQFVKDTGIGAFLDNLPKKTQQVIKAGIKKFGDQGFKPLEENNLGETAARKFEETLASLSLRFDQAVVTKGTQDELSILRDMERAIQARIATHGRTTDLLRLLFEVDQQRRQVVEGAAAAAETARQATIRKIEEAADKRREIAQKAKEALQAAQFRALGLSETGDEIVPGFKNLETRITAALQKISSGEANVSSKLANRLKLARKLIRSEGSKLTEETRRSINDLIKTVTGGFDELARTQEQSVRRITLSDKILEALGFDKTGRSFATGRNQHPFGPRITQVPPLRPVTTAATGGVTITGPLTVVANDPDAFLRELQKKAGRTSATSRGRFPGRSLGLG